LPDRKPWEPDEEGFYPGLDSKSVFDVPTLAVSRLLEGNVSFDTWRRLLVDRSSLSPQERTMWTDRLKVAAGGSALGNAFIDIATNPFVWFTFLTTPAGATALRSGGRLFAANGKSFVKWVGNEFPVLSKLRVLGADQQLYGTPISRVLDWVVQRKNELAMGQGDALAPFQRKYLDDLSARLGVKVESMDPTRAPRQARESLQRAHRLLDAFMEFGDDASTITRVSGKPVELVPVRLVGSKDTTLHLPRQQAEKLRAAYNEWMASGAPDTFNPFDRNLQNVFRKNELKAFEFNTATGRWSQSAVRRKPFAGVGSSSHVRFGADLDGVAVDLTESAVKKIARAGSIEKALRAEGLWDLATASINFRNNRIAALFARDDVWKSTGTFQIDPQKVERYLSTESARGARMPEVLEGLLGGSGFDEMRFFLQKKGVTNFVELLRKGGRFESQQKGFRDDLYAMMQRRYGDLVNNSKGGTRGGGTPSFVRDLMNKEGVVLDDAALSSGIRSADGADLEEVRKIKSTWHVDDLLELQKDLAAHGGTTNNQFQRLITESGKAQQQLALGGALYRRVRRLDWGRSINNFGQRTENQLVMSIDTVPGPVVSEINDYLYRDPLKSGGPRTVRASQTLDLDAGSLDSIPGLSEPAKWGVMPAAKPAVPPGGFNLFDVVSMSDKALRSSNRVHHADSLMNMFLPRALGEVNLRHTVTMLTILRAREAAEKLAKSGVGRAIRKSGSYGKSFIDRLEDYGQRPVYNRDAAYTLQRTAGHLYATHMGLNIPSIILNAMQPLLQAGSWVGYKNVLAAYKDSFQKLGEYARWRASSGALRLSALERRQAIRRILDPDDIMGLADDILDTIDNAHKTVEVPSWARTLLLDLPMKPFEKVEWLNRLVTVNAFKRARESALGSSSTWRATDRARFVSDAQRLLTQTQFTVNPNSSPQFMLEQGWFANPLARMFLQFPVRTVTSMLTSSKALAGGRRQIAGWEADWGGLAPAFDLMRMMGAGSIVYYAGKAVNFDATRGVAPTPFFEVVGGDRFLKEEKSFIPIPPAIDIPIDMVKGLLGGDMDSVRNAAFRLVPGGIALHRMFQTMPPIPVVGDVLQKRYADWSNLQPDGSIPVRDITGRTVEMPNAMEMVLRGIGFDFTRVNGPQELMTYMQRNNERYREVKWRVLRAMRAGDMSQANSIRQDFMNRTGIPVSVSQKDLDRFIQNADMTTPDRLYKTLPIPLKESIFRGAPSTGGPPLEEIQVPGVGGP
jgi:hypothetical protein